ncbi:MAG: hypothetical protein ACI94Y_003958 [Maribacter sp.]
MKIDYKKQSMQNSKLILLLKSFSVREYKEFQRFVASPFFNTNEEVVMFFTILKKLSPHFKEGRINKEQILKKMYPSKKFDDAHCKFLMNQLLKLAERYIAIANMEQKDTMKDYYLLDSYMQRGIDKNYQFILKKTKKILQSKKERDADFLHQEYLLTDIANLHFDKQSKRQGNEHLQQMVDTFDKYYMANKLKYTCQMLNNQSIISESYNISLAAEVSTFIHKNDYSHIPAVHLYHNLYMLLTGGKKGQFISTVQLFKDYRSTFGKTELRQILYFLVNFCIRQLKSGDDGDYYFNELFTLYQEGVDTGLLLEQGQINPWDYKNIIKIGLKLKRFTETESFIIDYNDKLKEQYKEDALHYNLAELYYYKKKPQKALEHLIEVEFSDIYYILGTKKILLKIYYETDEYDAMESLLISFQTYLKRNKLISENVRDTYLNFTKCLYKIIKNIDEDLSIEIDNTSPLIDKPWLMSYANPSHQK